MITPLAFDELAPELRERLQAKVDRLGYLGDFFAFTGHQPAALAAFIDFTEHLREALPSRLTEVVALTVAARAGNDYERVQHERLSLTNGCSEAWVRAVIALDPDSQTELGSQEASVQRLVLAALAEHGKAADEEFAGVVDLLGPEAAVAVLLTVGRYAAHALIANVLGLRPPVESPIAART
jgi:alkylhydroperoxidase family enzyme